MPAKQTLEIKILSCGGMFDLMSEMEAAFLVNSLGLYRNREEQGRGTPRANASLVRAYRAADFYRGVAGDEDVLHLIGHADQTTLRAGNGRSYVRADELERRARRGLSIPSIVVSTACNLDSTAWHSALKEAGATRLIASSETVTPANLTAFDMSFYSALLAQVRKGTNTTERVEASFRLANRHYKAIHAEGTSFATFRLVKL